MPTSLTAGDPAPWFTAATTTGPSFNFDTVGGYRIILSFFGSSKHAQSQRVLHEFGARQGEFEGHRIPFFGVTVDADDAALEGMIENPVYFKLVWDFDRAVSALYGVCRSVNASASASAASSDGVEYAPTTFVLNQRLQVVGVFPLRDAAEHVAQVMACATGIPAFGAGAIAPRQAPVLLVQNVLEPEFCRRLIDLYEADGGRDSGFMRQVDGKTVEILDEGFKKRRDLLLEDPVVLQQVNDRIVRRLKPEIEKVFQFSITRFERHLVACYDGQQGGFFNRHRDNTTKGTAHRRFAMTLNLNTGEYEGGCLWFPEYGPQLFRAGVGEAVIFSCSLLHEATPVVKGQRFALLSFFYNDEDAKVREQNQRYVVLKDGDGDGDARDLGDGSGDRSSHTSSSSQTSNRPPASAKRGFQPQPSKKSR
ncbi:MAG TPA: 2OG-Fe(II) oxygenase [Chroococcidiopsis sp.]